MPRSSLRPRAARASLCTVALLVAHPAEAREPSRDDDPYRDTVSVGVGFAGLPDYEGSNDYRIVPAPAAIGSIRRYGFVLIGNQVSVDLIRDRPGPVWDLQAGPVAQINFNRNSARSIDDRRVRALPSLGTAVELGGFVGIGKTGVLTSPYDKLSATVAYRHDVSGVHDAGIWQAGVNYITPVSTRAAIGAVASVDVVEKGYADTYYSITPDDASRSGLPVYAARGGLKSWTVGLGGMVSLTGNLLHGLKLVGGGRYGRMAGSIGDSPLVARAGSRDQWLAALGLGYTF